MKKLLLLSFLFICLSCSKEDNRPDCEKNDTGTFLLVNNSKNRYYITVNNLKQADLPGLKKQSFVANSGLYSIYVEQAEGYILTPTTKNFTINVFQCKESVVEFP
ncbi:MAG: hypothetical protein IT264_00050 [Saprospiraceae bacterium]|nr:hypothetical protein [Saprospiraceae bacterium]